VAEHIDKEIEAIKDVLNALEPLTNDVRASVLGYVLHRLQIVLSPSTLDSDQLPSGAGTAGTGGTGDTTAHQPNLPVHLKVFKEQKKPRSANEMAAVVAYYLANLAPSDQRKKTITTKDIETYFQIAEFPLTQARFTLPNAKSAGYLDAVGSGEYKLNPVGHNLVVHSLPRGPGSARLLRKKRAKKNRPTKKRPKSGRAAKKR
jgi:hypothetical protein